MRVRGEAREEKCEKAMGARRRGARVSARAPGELDRSSLQIYL